MAKKLRKLTDKQANYLKYRLKGMKVIDAHRKAYPGQKSSDKARGIDANKLEQDPRFSLVLDQARQKAFDDSIMTRDEALQRLTIHGRVAMTDVADFRNVKIGEDEDGNDVFQTVWTIKNAQDMDPKVAACIKSVTMTKDGPKIELHDSDKAVSQLRAMQGWDKPKKHAITDPEGKSVPLTANVSAPEIVAAMGAILEKL